MEFRQATHAVIIASHEPSVRPVKDESISPLCRYMGLWCIVQTHSLVSLTRADILDIVGMCL